MLGGNGLPAVRQVDQGVVTEEVGCLFLQKFENGDGQAPDLDVGCLVTAHLDEVAQRPGVRRHENLGLRGVGQDASRRLARLLAA